MPSILASLLGGIVLLLLSTRTLIRLSEILSYTLKLSPLFIGMTIVAIGTSLPELSVSTVASLNNDYALAVGNIIGSNIVNILLVFSVGILIGNLRIGTTKTQRNAIILLFFTTLYTYAHYLGTFSRQHLGLVFILLSLLLTFVEYKWAMFGRTHEDTKRFGSLEQVNFPASKWIMLALSLAGVITGGYFIVTSTEKLSLITGLSTGLLGLTLTAVATSLPELLTTIFSQEKHEEKITIGNVIGSNIYNLLLIGGIIDFLSPGFYPTNISYLPLNIATVIFVLIMFIYRGRVIPKWIGLVLLSLFLIYIIFETNKI